MELVVQSDKLIIQYPAASMLWLLGLGLGLFLLSKWVRQLIQRDSRWSFSPGILFALCFVFLIGGVNSYVFKIVLMPDRILLFNIQQFNHEIPVTKMSTIHQNDGVLLIHYEDRGQHTTQELILRELPEKSRATFIGTLMQHHQASLDK